MGVAGPMPSLEVHQFPCLQDNYGVLIHDAAAGVTASIDAPEAAAVRRALAEKGWNLTHILTTHHHGDHTGGNLELKRETGCTILGPAAEARRIPGIDQAVAGGDTFAFGSHEVRVIDTPGHTAGHIAYWIPDAGIAFVGDTLFAMGCGRLLEGDAKTMWASLQRLMKLPPETRLYCGHEYTVANARFALSIEPDNTELQQRGRESEAQRAAGRPTLPTRLDLELATNPFLRVGAASVRESVGMLKAPDWEVFAEIRERKNRA
jgi:hydroxyacylglutathione hydrolase